jgi:hypothetical protein
MGTMGTIPKKRADQLNFVQTHLDPWTVNGAAIGVAPDQSATMSEKYDAALSKVNLLLAAEQALADARLVCDLAMRDMVSYAAELVRAIRYTAISTNDPQVYALAGIPAPKTPAPVPAPGSPSKLNVAILAGGALQLKWARKNPVNSGGTMYEVHRASGAGPMVHIATTGTKDFTDQTLEPGTPVVTYRLIAVRSTVKGAASQFTVQFGAGGTGGGAEAAGSIGTAIVRKAA